MQQREIQRSKNKYKISCLFYYQELYRSICTYSAEYNLGEIDDGSGEPPTSPEAMVFMQSSAFPFMDNSPCSSPLNSPLLPVRHLLSVDLKRARSTSSLTSNTGAVSPVMELEEEEEDAEEEKRDTDGQELANPVDFQDEIYNDESSDDTISSLSNDFTGLFPHRKRDSLDRLGETVTSPDTSKPEQKTQSSPIAMTPKRPENLLLVPVGTNFGTSPSSPAAGIMSFDDEDDEETPAQDNSVYTFPGSTSPKRKISYQSAQLNPVKNTVHIKRSSTSVGRRLKPDVVDKSKEVNGDENKSKMKLFQKKLLPKKFSNAK